jgi:hypothetical protein
MNLCPCCETVLVQQFRQHQLGWFCRHCWQDMPLVASVKPLVAVVPLPSKVIALSRGRSRVELNVQRPLPLESNVQRLLPQSIEHPIVRHVSA